MSLSEHTDDICKRDVILTTCYESKEMNRNERKITKDMRVKIYLSSHPLDERKYKYSIYEVHEMTGS